LHALFVLADLNLLIVNIKQLLANHKLDLNFPPANDENLVPVMLLAKPGLNAFARKIFWPVKQSGP
jgi:hypothetical protein